MAFVFCHFSFWKTKVWPRSVRIFTFKHPVRSGNRLLTKQRSKHKQFHRDAFVFEFFKELLKGELWTKKVNCRHFIWFSLTFERILLAFQKWNSADVVVVYSAMCIPYIPAYVLFVNRHFLGFLKGKFLL